MLRTLLLVWILFVVEASAASKPNKALERCFFLKGKIEHYSQLRRGGGSHIQMASWQKSRSRYEEEFRTLRCTQFSSQLRRKKR